MKIIDISKDVMNCEVYPGDPTPSLERVKKIDDTKHVLELKTAEYKDEMENKISQIVTKLNVWCIY